MFSQERAESEDNILLWNIVQICANHIIFLLLFFLQKLKRKLKREGLETARAKWRRNCSAERLCSAELGRNPMLVCHFGHVEKRRFTAQVCLRKLHEVFTCV